MQATQFYESSSCISMAGVEVVEVPHQKLFTDNMGDAEQTVQTVFSQILQGIFRIFHDSSLSIELRFVSEASNNQIYNAQVRIFLILRLIGNDALSNEKIIKSISSELKARLESLNYFIRIIELPEKALDLPFGNNDNTHIISVAKKERIMTDMMSGFGGIYYTESIKKKDTGSLTEIINTLSRYPDCSISVIVIPTSYSKFEMYSIEEVQNYLLQRSSVYPYMRMQEEDINLKSLKESYDVYSSSMHEENFICHIIVSALEHTVSLLADKVIDVFVDHSLDSSSPVTGMDVSTYLNRDNIDCWNVPWRLNDILINEARSSFWSGEDAPFGMLRMQYLMRANEISLLFKLPVGSDEITGLKIKELSENRRQLHDSILSKESFHLGVIGGTSGRDRENLDVGLSLNDFSKHGLIVGMPGSGKTNFSLGILLRFWKKYKIPFLAIEPTKTEYRSLMDEIEDIQIFTPGKTGVSPFVINPFIPPKGVTIESYIPSLTSAFKAAFSMPNPLDDIFTGAIVDAYNEYGWMSSSMLGDPGTELFGLYEFVRVFKRNVGRLSYKGEVRANIESAGIVRLTSLLEQNGNIYDTVNTIPIEEMLERPTVIELNAIGDKEHKSLLIALLLIQICSHTKNNVCGDGKLKNIILIDEAHVLLDAGRAKTDNSADPRGKTVEALEDMIAEIRSYGTGIIIADQSPEKVGKNIVSNTNVKVIFRLLEKTNRDIIANALDMDDNMYDAMGRLGVGDAILHHEKLYDPISIHTYDIKSISNIRPVIADQEVKDKNSFWDTHSDLLIPHKECIYSNVCKNGCDYAIRTRADFISSRLVNEYLFGIDDKKGLAAFMASINRATGEYVPDEGEREMIRLRNCIKIKFFRKALIKREFSITKREQETIFTHPNVMET